MQLYTSGILRKSEFPKIQFNAIQLNFFILYAGKITKLCFQTYDKKIMEYVFFPS